MERHARPCRRAVGRPDSQRALVLVPQCQKQAFGDYARKDAPFFANILFGAMAGAIWVCQFVCFKTGEPQMGNQAYVGWAVLMASSIMFSGVLGLLILGEWKGTSGRTRGLLVAGLLVLLASSVIAGYSGKLGQDAEKAQPAVVRTP